MSHLVQIVHRIHCFVMMYGELDLAWVLLFEELLEVHSGTRIFMQTRNKSEEGTQQGPGALNAIEC